MPRKRHGGPPVAAPLGGRVDGSVPVVDERSGNRGKRPVLHSLRLPAHRWAARYRDPAGRADPFDPGSLSGIPSPPGPAGSRSSAANRLLSEPRGRVPRRTRRPPRRQARRDHDRDEPGPSLGAQGRAHREANPRSPPRRRRFRPDRRGDARSPRGSLSAPVAGPSGASDRDGPRRTPAR